MQPNDDSALLRRYAENQSDEAFAELVARYLNLVYSVALRQVGRPHQAGEITQAVFIILAKKAPQLRHHQALSSWLFQTTRLTANNFLRGEIRRQRREQEAYMQSTLNEPTGEAWPHIAPLLDAAVAGLGEKDRRAILLRFYEGRSLRDAGLALGASEAATEKRVSRAVEKLRAFFRKRGIVLSAAAIAAAASANSVSAAPAGLTTTVSAIAAAKGATASASTLTLIKGALKLMAWTKAKTAVIVGLGVALVVGTTVVSIKTIDANAKVDEVLSLMNTWNEQHPTFRIRSRDISSDGNTNSERIEDNNYLKYNGQWKDKVVSKDPDFTYVMFSAGSHDYLMYFPITRTTVGGYLDKDELNLYYLGDWRTKLTRKMAAEYGFTITLLTNTPPFCIRIAKDGDSKLKQEWVIDAEGKELGDLTVTHNESGIETFQEWNFDEQKIAEEFALIQVKTNVDTSNFPEAMSNEIFNASHVQK